MGGKPLSHNEFHTTHHLVPCTTLNHTRLSEWHCTPRKSIKERSSSEPTPVSQPHPHSAHPISPSDTTIHPSAHPSPNTHTGPSGLISSSHWLVHKLCAHYLLFHRLWSIFARTPARSKTISQTTTRSTTRSGTLASVPGGALCTAGVTMLGSTSSDQLVACCLVSKCGIFVDLCALSPAEQARTTFQLPGLVQAIYFACLALGHSHSIELRTFYPFSMDFHRHFTNTSIFAHTRAYFGSPPPTIVHLGDFSSYGPSAITYPPIPIQTTPFSIKLY